MSETLNHLLPATEGPTLCYLVSSPVTVSEYTEFLILVRNNIEKYGEFRLYLLYDHFQGWDAEAANMDVSFYVEYGKYLKKFCLVNPPEKEIMSKMLTKPMISGELKIFSKERQEEALAWVKS